MPVSLPIDEVLPKLVETLKSSASVVLHAPTGAGKTTRVPPALWDAGLSENKQIVMLEPRRLAARGAARRITDERNESLGELVGYQVRFDSRSSRNTKILTVTDGILLRRLQEDPFLEQVGVVIFDEFHERGLESDVCLGMVRRIQQDVRPDLKIVVMSATLAAEPVSEYLGNCPIVRSEGRLHPVEVQYLRRSSKDRIEQLVAAQLPRVLEQTRGDVLIFLPGVGEIFRTQRELEPLAKRENLELLPLHGGLSLEQQDAVLALCSQRKIVLATNVAETSITIEGITAVIDSGLARIMQFDPSVGLDRLELSPISQASADQRAGRAGRTEPGVCLRLWEKSRDRQHPQFETAEIQRVDLSGTVLQLAVWGETNLARFPWFEPPRAESLEHAEQLLVKLGALDDSGPTLLGITMSRLPVSPRLARLLIEGHRLGEIERIATVAALISERSPFRQTDRRGTPRDVTIANHQSDSDVVDLLETFEEACRSNQYETHLGRFDRGAGRNIQRIADQLSRIIADTLGPPADPQLPQHEIIQRALLLAFPDRLAKRRDLGRPRGIMVGGRGVQLAPRSVVLEAELFLCIDVDDKSANATVRLASGVRKEWLDPKLLRTTEEVFFHPTLKQVVARKRTSWDDLILDESPLAISDNRAAAETLFNAALPAWQQIFPKDNRELNEFLARVEFLRASMPELALPALDQSGLEAVLRSLCQFCRSFDELKKADWLGTIKGQYSYQQLQTLDREAPDRLHFSSGKQIRLNYEAGKPPVLPVKIQELFGMRETPRIAGGRVPVLLHLLAPNQRPQQVTDDLASFWKNTYPQVRKDLRRRYSKHPWPEDPLVALPKR